MRQMDTNSPVEIVLGPSVPGDWRAQLQSVAATEPLTPFSEPARAFTKALSRHILGNRAMTAYPELMAMAHWLRPAHVEELCGEFEQRNRSRIRRPRGLAVHFAPGNVDTLFVYSWMISLLAGNANVLRVSTRVSPQMTVLQETLGQLVDAEDHQAIRDRLLILRYPHDDAVSAALSEVCHVRVLWGGDETIRALRPLPLPARAVEMAFPDRFSAAVLSATAVLVADEDPWDGLVGGFVNDAFWFNQQACASPRLLLWVGQAGEVDGAKARFWPAVAEALADRAWSLEPAEAITRLTAAYAIAARGDAQGLDVGTARGPARLAASRLDPAVRELHAGNGLFVEITVPTLEAAFRTFADKDQTVTAFGFDRTEMLREAHRLPAGAVDRIVPVGTALTFDSIWDGVDLFDLFTREIVLP